MGDRVVPTNLREAAQHDESAERRDWVARLPHLVEAIAERWSLDVGEPFQPGGQTAWVAPALLRDGSSAVLKVAWRHPESEGEAAGLAEWGGAACVRLLAAEAWSEDTMALLIERCIPGTTLASRPEHEQDEVIAALLARLWCEPRDPGVFPSLQSMCDAWADEYEAKAEARREALADARLVADGAALFRALPGTAPAAVLLCTDLHAGNVVRAEREPWLLIDPKPHLGDPTYDPLQHMLNCRERLLADPRGLAARMADLLELERERLVAWLFARCAVESVDDPELARVARLVAPA